MSPVSRTEAHKVFADLYRKQRSPEHQQLIDDAIQRSNDVFIRIDLIKKIDEDYGKKNKPEEKKEPQKEKPTFSLFGGAGPEIKKEPAKSEAKPKRPADSSTGTVEVVKQKIVAKAGSEESDEDSGNASNGEPKKKKEKEKDKEGKAGGGFLSGLFGGGGGSGPNSITKFAKETGAIEIGLFGRNPVVSGSVEKLFRGLKEDIILPTIQGLRVADQQGWRIWTPLVYNVISNYCKFFNAFVSLDALFIDKISPDIFLDRSLKMQMFYIRLLQRADAKSIIIENLPTLLKQDEKLSGKQNTIMIGVNYGLNLENTKPKLSEALMAFYTVSRKKFYSWEEIVAELKVPPMQENKFIASPEVQKEVEITVAKIADDITTRIYKKDELQNMRERYFSIDEKGKLSFEFLNPIVDDYMGRHMPEQARVQSVKNAFKSMPHKLLYLLVRDFQNVYISLLEGYVKVGDKGAVQEALLIQPGLFRSEIESMNGVVRSLDGFNRKFPSFQYNFQQFNADFTNGATDQIVTAILATIAEASEFFGNFANKMNTIYENHLMAIQSSKGGKVSERLATLKDKPIDDFKISQRFLPFYEKTFLSRERIHGQTVEEVFFQMTKYLYNFAVIFKDTQTTAKLTAHKKIDQDLEKMHKEYERLTYSKFDVASATSGRRKKSQNAEPEAAPAPEEEKPEE